MKQTVNYSTSAGTINVNIPIPHNRYVDKVLRSSSYEELMWRFLEAASPSKEISESYAAFSNMKKVCKISDYTWLHIGDGGYTRTAAIFAFFSKSLNFSIDPNLNFDKFNAWSLKYGVFGVIPRDKKFEDVSEKNILNEILFQSLDKEYSSNYNICCVHTHVNLEEVDKQYPRWKFLYTNPCCQPGTQVFSKKYMYENNIVEVENKLDLGILSDKRHIIIYRKKHTIPVNELVEAPPISSNRVKRVMEEMPVV